MKINIDPDCGNAPKKIFLKDLNIALAEGNMTFLSDSVADEITWNLIGDQQIEGKENFISHVKETQQGEVSELTLDKILTHGKDGAVSGILKMQSGEIYAFADFYEFNSAKSEKVKSITSYAMKVG